MPCYHPLQAYFSVREDGKKDIEFSQFAFRRFRSGLAPGPCQLGLPCGRCMGCRLERSRQWALRCMHEAKCHEQNCFITLTFNSDFLPEMCPGGSLVRRHLQDFMKRLRNKFVPPIPDGLSLQEEDIWRLEHGIRVFGCGEYGERNDRPHYHLCLFGFCFSDLDYLRSENGFKYYTSDVLSKLWPYGFSIVTGFSFEAAAYVARYCVKKVNGPEAVAHYHGRLPEFAIFSNRPGIGKPWLDKFGKTDVFPHDDCLVNGVKCLPPRYYDKIRERDDPEGYALAKEARRQRAVKKAADSTYDRLLVREKCHKARSRLLVRKLES